MDAKKFHIVLVTPGQPATNPRLVKEATSLAHGGYKVTVVYSYWTNWALQFDAQIIQENSSVNWQLVAGSPHKNTVSFFFSRVMHRVFKYSSVFIPAHKKYRIGRSSFALINATQRIQADLYIAHNLAALPAAAMAAKKNKAIYAFDAEDYHRGQSANATEENKLAATIENRYLPGVAYLSAASPLIAAKYQGHYPDLTPVMINNVFSIHNSCMQVEEYRGKGSLRLFWFSQTVGSGRGIEMVIGAMNDLKGIPLEFTILGYCTEAEKERLLKLAGSVGSQLQFISPVAEKELFKIAAQHHIGLALEVEDTVNRDICLTNKLFTYLLSGLAIIATRTTAQNQFLQMHPGVGKVLTKGDEAALEVIIREWYDNPEALNASRSNALSLAKKVFNWEAEQEMFLHAVNAVLSKC